MSLRSQRSQRILVNTTAVVVCAILVFSLTYVSLKRSELPLQRAAKLRCSSTSRVASNISTVKQHEQHEQDMINSSPRCPEYFKWINRDLEPWRKGGGITRQNVEDARRRGSLRVTFIAGELYTDIYGKCPQSRALFTVWGLLMLLDRFPGKVPDVDFIVNCKDRPVVPTFRRSLAPPVMFSYCTSKGTFDIPIPDYSFWGWPEVNILPWAEESRDIFAASNELPWQRRKPVAFWKGNSRMGKLRKHLLNCNSTEAGALIYEQNWISENENGFRNSKLSEQCKHRYNIYVEGASWSASLKYRMSCGSTMLKIKSEYEEFFSRGLLPNIHYIPISSERTMMCQTIHEAVEWGNSHSVEAEAVGRRGQNFMEQEVSVKHVYDYMFHLISQYAKLQRFVPRVPPRAQLICKNAIRELISHKRFTFEEHVEQDSHHPCTLVS